MPSKGGKEIRFTPGTDDHDFDFQSKTCRKFLKDGNKVKAYVQFGRAITCSRKEVKLVLVKFAERFAEVGRPKHRQSRRQTMLLMLYAKDR